MTQSNHNLVRLLRISRYGEWICLLGIFLVGGYAMFLVAQPAEAIAVLQRGILAQPNLPSDQTIMLAGAVALLPVVIFIYALWRAYGLFGLIGSGYFLSEKSQWLMLHLGRLAIVLAVLSFVTRSLVVLLMTSANQPGQRLLTIEIDSGQISSVIVAVLLFTFSHLLKEMASIEEENRNII
jgi:Protein of unknown function (DUF2975)